MGGLTAVDFPIRLSIADTPRGRVLESYEHAYAMTDPSSAGFVIVDGFTGKEIGRGTMSDDAWVDADRWTVWPPWFVNANGC